MDYLSNAYKNATTETAILSPDVWRSGTNVTDPWGTDHSSRRGRSTWFVKDWLGALDDFRNWRDMLERKGLWPARAGQLQQRCL